MLNRWQLARQLETIRSGKMPHHIAIIMDGNGRWAKKRGLPRVAGHRQGMQAIKRCLAGLKGLDVKYLTLYAFSTENWRRPKSEVDFLMNLPGQFIGQELTTIVENNIKLGVIGDVSGLPAHTRKAIAEGIEATRHNTGLRLNFALNYGGREEILQAVRALCRRCQQGDLDPSAITYSDIESCLYTRDIPSPDLVIRTSGEIRISNFLLWQIAYAELYFTDTLWPDFSEMHLYKAIAQFQRRNRRFGGV
ncbi:MAG TPA: isoprenyl transferase [Bacillota bacterium]|nr:isoprenyl transferase [Bacillota bacterium]HPZ90116.1 isoprenyl transferase [Bacillota bacterium]HQE01062.1 isoprenyl transferase [Bacillota bacterium]